MTRCMQLHSWQLLIIQELAVIEHEKVPSHTSLGRTPPAVAGFRPTLGRLVWKANHQTIGDLSKSGKGRGEETKPLTLCSDGIHTAVAKHFSYHWKSSSLVSDNIETHSRLTRAMLIYRLLHATLDCTTTLIAVDRPSDKSKAFSWSCFQIKNTLKNVIWL